MAEIPVPRSYQRILGEMIDAVQSRVGFENYRVGGPLLSFLEAAAQSDLRATQDIFSMLDAANLDRATGKALDLIGADESVPRKGAGAATGFVTITDTSFTKKATSVYTGAAAPTSGSTSILVANAATFPTVGSIYIGRGTTNVEGPLVYTSITPVGTHYQINLASPTTRFHNLGEVVLLAQGGLRTIPSGTSCKTKTSSTSKVIEFSTVFPVTVLDGDTVADNVLVVCTEGGVIGNVPKGSITEITGVGFTASCINNSPLTNGADVEKDPAYRERIRAARQSRQKATPLALKNAALGVTASDESKRVVSANVVARSGETTVLYIDDGTGYEEATQSVGSEIIVASALGGEDLFQLENRPVARSFAKSINQAPYVLADDMRLAVRVGSTIYEHTFSGDDFRTIEAANVAEVVASINANSALGFSARSAENATLVSIFPKDGQVEELQVTTPVTAGKVDSNTAFGFTTISITTLKLYKNDIILYENGAEAVISSAQQINWGTIATGVTLILNVDGTGNRTFTITDADFANAGTVYGTVSQTNTLESWVKVFNYKLAGVTASFVGDRIYLTSNKGSSLSASLVIDGSSTLVSGGMFTLVDGLSDTGRDNDYTFDRNTSQIKLTTPLVEGDRLTVGTDSPGGYIDGTTITGASVVFSATARLFLIADGNPAIVSTNLTKSTSVTGTSITGTFQGKTFYYNRYTGIAGLFSALQEGDWFILWDPAATNHGAYRVDAIAGDGSWFNAAIANPADDPANTGAMIFSAGGWMFVRTQAGVQRPTIAAGTYTLDQIVTLLNSGGLLATEADTHYNDRIRIRTNTLASNGGMMLVGANTEGQKLLLMIGAKKNSEVPHLAFVESGDEYGTPYFTTTQSVGGLNLWLRPFYNTANPRFGVNVRERQVITATGPVVYKSRPTTRAASGNDRFMVADMFQLTSNDDVSVIIDQDQTSKNYTIPLYRRAIPGVAATYGSSFVIRDADNGNLAFSSAFGSSFDFTDFGVAMRPRVKSYLNSTLNKSILFRFSNFGAGGEVSRIAYGRPAAPGAALTTSLVRSNANLFYKIHLPGGTARTGLQLLGSTRFDVTVNGTAPGDLTFARATRTTAGTEVTRAADGKTVTWNFSASFDFGLATGDVVHVVSTDANFNSGAYVVTVLTAHSFTYQDVGTPSVTSAAPQPLTFSYSAQNPDFTNVVVGDICRLDAGTGALVDWAGLYTVTAKTASTVRFRADRTITNLGGTPGQRAPTKLLDPTKLTFYPITSTLASAIVTFVNGGSSGLQGIISAIAVEDGGGAPGTGSITAVTEDEFLSTTNNYGASSVLGWAFTDGHNYISAMNMGTGSMTLAIAPDTNLLANNDFTNEQFRLIPRSAKNVSDFLSSPAITGLFGVADVKRSTNGNKVQIATKTVGADGSVIVSGGTGNAASATVVGLAENATSATVLKVPFAQAKGFAGLSWVRVQNSVQAAKALPTAFTAVTQFTYLRLDPDTVRVTRDDGGFWQRTWNLTAVTSEWRVERHGRYACYVNYDIGTDIGSPSVTEGQILDVSVAAMSASNQGRFPVVAFFTQNSGGVDFTYIWVENTVAVEQTVAMNGGSDFMRAYNSNSALPGDILHIPPGAVAQTGDWVIEDIGATDGVITINNTTIANAAVTLGSGNYLYYAVIEGQPASFIKNLTGIVPIPNDDSAYVVLARNARYLDIADSKGTVLKALDKLDFPTTLQRGVDGYHFNTGLIGEVNKVIYGVESDPVTYPGVAAAGSTVDIRGPLVRRIQTALNIRLRTGLNSREIIERVKGAVATYVNDLGVGDPVSIAEIVAAAQGVDGVLAVTITSPIFGVGNDLIEVQSYEKPLIVNVDQDVLVKLIGA